MSGATDIESIVDDESVLELEKLLQDVKATCCESRTGKLWLSFMDFVSTCRLFITAERTGNWALHLKATQDMLPLFAATGHNNYAKCCRLYLQDAQNLCSCMDEKMKDGLFTVHRNKALFWSGTWTDMVIEQCLMRSGKTTGGLINITHREAAKTVWLLAAHIIAQYSDGLRSLTNNYSGTWSAQHRDMSNARVKNDALHMEKFLNFLKSHNPFSTPDGKSLVNISTGLIADERVNVERADEIGRKIQSSITGRSIGNMSFKRSEQVVTFSVMKKGVSIAPGEKIHVSTAELSQRLIAIASLSQQPDPNLYSYELSSVAPAIFTDDGVMRKTQKSQLGKYLTELSSDICVKSVTPMESKINVIDGCAVLQQLPWPKVGTVQDSVLLFVNHICANYKKFTDQEPYVIFDSYGVTTTKEPEQKRRRLNAAQSAEVVFREDLPIPSNKVGFLSNKSNKQNYIFMLDKFLTERGIHVEHAGDEGDADVVIVRNAIQLAEMNETVKVISEDTDILIMLLHHVSGQQSVYMQTKTKLIDIKMAQAVIGEPVCKLLPFVHAMSGCDTTSSFFGLGKVKSMKILEKLSEAERKKFEVFGSTTSSKEEIGRAGENFLISLYAGKTRTVQTLDELRYLNMMSTKYVPMERLPPTSRAAHFHSLRVHLQTCTWLSLRTILPKEEFGFTFKNGELKPVITDKKPAPPELLDEIRCSCSKGELLCTSCSCRKRRLPCSIHCKCGGECENAAILSSETSADNNTVDE